MKTHKQKFLNYRDSNYTARLEVHTLTRTQTVTYITSSMGTVIEVTHIINASFSTTTLIRAGYHL